MTETPEQILTDWEEQALERDWRDPTRVQIFKEAAIIRAALQTLTAERDAALAREAAALETAVAALEALPRHRMSRVQLGEAVLAIRTALAKP